MFYPEDLEVLETWISISNFKYFWVVRIEKQIRSFVFWEKLQLDNFVMRSTALYICTKYELPRIQCFNLCVPPDHCVLFLQCLAFRFKIPWATHGSLDISFPWLFSEPFSSWTSFLVFSAGEFYPSMFCLWELGVPKKFFSLPSIALFFLVKSMLQFHVVLFR